MIRKGIIITILLCLAGNGICNTVCALSSIETVKFKLKNQQLLNTYVLCFAEKGLVIWHSSVAFSSRDIDKYAEYIPYDNVQSITMGGSFSLAPIIVGGVLSGVLILNAMNSPKGEDRTYAILIAAVLTVPIIALSTVVSIFSMFIPRSTRNVNYERRDKISSKYVLFTEIIPPELKEYIESYEKD